MTKPELLEMFDKLSIGDSTILGAVIKQHWQEIREVLSGYPDAEDAKVYLEFVDSPEYPKCGTFTETQNTEPRDTIAVQKSVFAQMCSDLQRLNSENEKLREALIKLVNQLEALHASEDYRAVWCLSQIHNGPYTGPTYTAELNAAKARLEGK
jgi:hypothetical protein